MQRLTRRTYIGYQQRRMGLEVSELPQVTQGPEMHICAWHVLSYELQNFHKGGKFGELTKVVPIIIQPYFQHAGDGPVEGQVGTGVRRQGTLCLLYTSDAADDATAV